MRWQRCIGPFSLALCLYLLHLSSIAGSSPAKGNEGVEASEQQAVFLSTGVRPNLSFHRTAFGRR
jgi:hypothetical protein